MRVAAYYRVSTSRKEQDDSLKNQEDAANRYALHNDFIVSREYSDRASGTTFDRDGIQELMDDMDKGMYDIILCKELSRIARNVALQYRFLEKIENKGMRLIAVDGSFDSDDHDKRGYAGLLAWLYEKEAENTSVRIKQSFTTKAENGLFIGSLAPYGYKIEDKKLIPRADYTADVLVDIFNKYLEGWGFDKIARYLNNSGYKTPAQVSGKIDAGRLWYGTSVKKILTNPAYIGDLVAHRESSISAINKKRRKIPEHKQIKVKGTHPPLIDKDLWSKVQDKIKSKSSDRSKAKGEAHLFIGFLRCPDCGKGFHFRQDRRGYICATYGKHGKGECSSHAVKEQKLVDLILDDIKSFSINIDSDGILEKVRKKTDSSNRKIKSKVKRITNELDEKKKLRIDLTNMRASGELDKEQYRENMNAIKIEVDRLENEKASLEDSLNNSDDIDKLAFLKNELENFLKFDTLTKDMLNLLVEKIEVHETGEPVIYYRFAPVLKQI